MGFCLSCGNLANTERCPKCKGKVSGASGTGLSNRDAWSETYLGNKNKKVVAPNLSLLSKQKSLDITLETDDNISVNPNLRKTFSDEPKIKDSTEPEILVDNCEKCKLPVRDPLFLAKFDNKCYHKSCFVCTNCSEALETPSVLDSQLVCKECLNRLNSSSTSSPTLMTPDEELDSAKNANSTGNKHARVPSMSSESYRSKLNFSNGNNAESGLPQVNDKLRNLKLNGRNQESLMVPSQSLAPQYSRTYQNLQATVANTPAKTLTLNARPRKTSEASSTGNTSFSELMKLRNENRRSTSIKRDNSTSKRMSMPVLPRDPLPSTENTNRLAVPNPISSRPSFTRPRPMSSAFSKSVDLTIKPPLPVVDSLPALVTPPENLVTSPTAATSFEKSASDSEVPSKTEKPMLTAASKMACDKCKKAVGDTWFRLLDGRVLHKECFMCQHCLKPIEDGKYSMLDDREFHTECLMKVSASPMSDASLEPEDFCDRCQLIISGPCFTLTNGRQYHPHCFICAGCKQKFEQGTYVSQGDLEYHRECVPKKDLIPCAKCHEPIKGVFVTNNNQNFHSQCFRCTGCSQIITPSTPFGEVNQSPYCEPCLIQQRTSRQSSFALSAARQEQRKAASTSTPFQ